MDEKNQSTYPPPVETPHTDMNYPIQGPAPGPSGNAPPPYQPPSHHGQPQSGAPPEPHDTAYPPSTAPPPDYQAAATQPPVAPYSQQPMQQPAQQPVYPVQQFAQAPPPPLYAQPPGYPMGGAGAPGYSHVPPPPPAPGMTTVVIQHQRPVYGPHPISVTCPKCQAQITTNTDTKIGNMAWMAVGGVLLFGIFIFPLVLLGCCFIPLCIPSLKDVVHSCPNCHQVVGHYNRSGRL